MQRHLLRCPMAITRTEVTRETARRMRRFWLQNGEEIRRLREEAGVSLGGACRQSPASTSHTLRGSKPVWRDQAVEVLTAIGVALGAELSLRYYPGSGPRLHDRFQAPMVETLLRELDARWTARLEVPITAAVARRHRPRSHRSPKLRSTVACEVQSELRRLEQQIRWSTEKADGLRWPSRRDRPECAAFCLTLTRPSFDRSDPRDRPTVRDDPRYGLSGASADDVVRALTTSSAPWPGAGIVWMNLHGRSATLMAYPPRGVSLGR